MKRKISLEDMDKEVDLFHKLFPQDEDDEFAYCLCKMRIRDDILDKLMNKYSSLKLNNDEFELAKKLTKVMKKYIEEFDKVINQHK